MSQMWRTFPLNIFGFLFPFQITFCEGLYYKGQYHNVKINCFFQIVWIEYGTIWYKEVEPFTVHSCSSPPPPSKLYWNRKLSYNFEQVILTLPPIGFLPIGNTSSLNLSFSHTAYNGKDASLLTNSVDIQIIASLFGSHSIYAIFIKVLLKDKD